MQENAIDAVITWVNGNDPVHKAKRQAYITGRNENRLEDIGGDVRYDASGEIFICVGSILRFAPFVRKIFIVTDAQDPCIDSFVKKNFPDTATEIEIVDHKVIFEGYEEYLPTFNSLTIETMLYRIPGLSERFVYFNDDVFLASPASESIWYKDGHTVCYATRFSAAVAAFLRALKPSKGGHKPFGFKDAMLNTARLLGTDYFWYTSHSPLPLRKSVLKEYFDNHPDSIIRNIRFRFRDASQYNPQTLYYILAEKKGECTVVSPGGKTVFFKPDKNRPGYLGKKIAGADRNSGLMFGCINSLGEAPEADRLVFEDWIRHRLDLM